MVFSAIALLGIAAVALPVGPRLEPFVHWARGAGFLGVLAFAAAYAVCALLLLPGWPLRVAAGLVYGPAWGFAVAAPASFLAATLAFLVGRSLLRGRIARRIASEPRLAAVDDAVAENALWIVLLLRLSPIFPNEVVNYGLGATRVRLRDYAVASFVGMLPLTVTYTWLGSLLTAMTDVGRGRPLATGTLAQVMWWLGLAATVAVAAVVMELARRALHRRLRLAPARVPSADAAAPTYASVG